MFLKSEPVGAKDNHYQRIVLVEHEDLNVPDNPCNEDPDYSFRACVSRKVSGQVRCRRKLDFFSDKSLPLCTNLQQFR